MRRAAIKQQPRCPQRMNASGGNRIKQKYGGKENEETGVCSDGPVTGGMMITDYLPESVRQERILFTLIHFPNHPPEFLYFLLAQVMKKTWRKKAFQRIMNLSFPALQAVFGSREFYFRGKQKYTVAGSEIDDHCESVLSGRQWFSQGFC